MSSEGAREETDTSKPVPGSYTRMLAMKQRDATFIGVVMKREGNTQGNHQRMKQMNFKC